MEAFECYKLYLSLKLHFTKEAYNYFKHRRTSATPKAFDKRNDSYFFHKLADLYTEEQLVEFFVSQLIVTNQFWIGDSFSEKNQEIYNLYLKCKQSLSRQLQQELQYLYSTYTDKELYNPSRGYPKIIAEYLRGKVRLETLVILDRHISWSSNIDLIDGIVWTPLKFLMFKYKPFLDYYNMNTFSDIYNSIVSDNQLLRNSV